MMDQKDYHNTATYIISMTRGDESANLMIKHRLTSNSLFVQGGTNFLIRSNQSIPESMKLQSCSNGVQFDSPSDRVGQGGNYC